MVKFLLDSFALAEYFFLLVPHPEIASEQAHVDRAYARIDVLTGVTKTRLAEVRQTLGDDQVLEENIFVRDVASAVGARRLAQLKIGDLPLCFGRLDTVEDDELRIGRVGVSEQGGDVLVVDWRAPAAEPFYRATPIDPMGATLRRQFLTQGRRILDLDDEVFGADVFAETGSTHTPSLRGTGALMAALTAVRTGRMGDIVATIQREQDQAIRAPLAGVHVVQGGPGTGKTAVALHRAAYLLYSHRARLERTGVLVLGPNAVFVRYIEHVLPALGEDAVTLGTIATLVEGVDVGAPDTAGASLVKADERMAEVLERALRRLQRPLAEPALIALGYERLRLSREESQRIVRAARRRPGPHNERRDFVERTVLAHLWQKHLDAGGELAATSDAARHSFENDVRSTAAFRTVVHRMWPVLEATTLVDLTLSSRPLLAAAARDLLTDAEVESLLRPASSPWTVADVPLVDEAAALLGDKPSRRSRWQSPLDHTTQVTVERTLAYEGVLPECPRCNAELTMVLDNEGKVRRWICDVTDCQSEWRTSQVLEGPEALRVTELVHAAVQRDGTIVAPDVQGFRQYGHVLIDEAQELSPMAWRMVARRCPTGSMTIVGDLGQASGAWAARSWDEVLARLPGGDRGAVAELTVNYRTPSEIMQLAARVLAVAAPGLVPPAAVRDEGVGPELVGTSDMEAAVAAAIDRLRAELPDGHVAVIVPTDDVDRYRDLVGGGDDVLESGLAVLDADLAKGLEFDAVVVVDPMAVVSDVGLRGLYVALTRATRRMTIVHTGVLPPGIDEGIAATA